MSNLLSHIVAFGLSVLWLSVIVPYCTLLYHKSHRLNRLSSDYPWTSIYIVTHYSITFQFLCDWVLSFLRRFVPDSWARACSRIGSLQSASFPPIRRAKFPGFVSFSLWFSLFLCRNGLRSQKRGSAMPSSQIRTSIITFLLLGAHNFVCVFAMVLSRHLCMKMYVGSLHETVLVQVFYACTYQANVTDSRQTDLRPPRLTSIARPNYEHSTTANICILDWVFHTSMVRIISKYFVLLLCVISYINKIML